MKIEIGGGPFPAHPEFVQVDAIDWSERTQLEYTIADARKLPFRDGECEEVFASNLLEHFPASETTAVLTEWARVLKVGGKLEIVVPDVVGILRDFFKGINDWNHCEERLRGSRDYPGNEHHNAFTLWEFPHVLAKLPNLQLVSCHSSHAGGGVTAVARKVR